MKILLLIPILCMVGCASPYKYTKMNEQHKTHFYKEENCGYCKRTI